MVAGVIPYLPTLWNALTGFTIASSVLAFSSQNSVSGLVDSLHSGLDKDEIDRITNKQEFINSMLGVKPVVKETANVSNPSPVTLPDYLLQNNELINILAVHTQNQVTQLEQQNDIQTEMLKATAKSAEHFDTLTSILNTTLPALVVQMQQLAKVTGVLTMTSDIEVAYKEVELANHEQLITTLQNLNLALTVPPDSFAVNNTVNVPDTSLAIGALIESTNQNTLTLQSISENLVNVSNNASTQKILADYKITAQTQTRIDGTTYANISPIEIETQTNIALAEAKMKEKEIADYQTTAIDIKNLDGNIVASVKPMEAHAIKNITIAKNQTDEMEYTIPQDLLDDLFDIPALPTYNLLDWESQKTYCDNYAGIGVTI